MTSYAYTTISTPIGALQLIATESHLTHLTWENEHKTQINGWPVRREDTHAILSHARNELLDYFDRKITRFTIPLQMEGTPFQQQVWDALQTIPYGEVISYAELARMINNSSAMRAVGNANGRNPVAIIVPCHRVIGANYGLGGYAGGLQVKRTLLELEGLTLDAEDRVNRHARLAA